MVPATEKQVLELLEKGTHSLEEIKQARDIAVVEFLSILKKRGIVPSEVQADVTAKIDTLDFLGKIHECHSTGDWAGFEAMGMEPIHKPKNSDPWERIRNPKAWAPKNAYPAVETWFDKVKHDRADVLSRPLSFIVKTTQGTHKFSSPKEVPSMPDLKRYTKPKPKGQITQNTGGVKSLNAKMDKLSRGNKRGKRWVSRTLLFAGLVRLLSSFIVVACSRCSVVIAVSTSSAQRFGPDSLAYEVCATSLAKAVW